mgnify:CR=1 FL=1
MESLKRNYDFQKVYTEGKSYANRYLVMYLLKNKTEKNRIGNRRKGHKYAAYADNFFLPFALLAAKTFLPPALLILALNPWLFGIE